MEVKYYLDGVNLKTTYNLRVAESRGVLDFPGYKDTIKGDWPDQHGHIIDLALRTIESRKISLDCSITADDAVSLGTTMAAFMDTLNDSGLMTLKITVDDPEYKPLFYLVYLDGGITVKKRWKDGTMAAFFTLNFVEPEPLKKILLYERTESSGVCTLTITSTDPLNIYWGKDQWVTYNIRGTGVEASCTYDRVGFYYIIITGKIDGATVTLPANVTEVWSRL